MSNILNFFNNLEFRLFDKNYWDFYINSNEVDIFTNDSTPIEDKSIVNFDFNNNLTISGNTIYSLSTWDDFINNGVSANTFGLTGIDNGFINYNYSGDPTNTELVNLLTGSTLFIQSGDGRLFLSRISGSTGQFVYPTDFSNDPIMGNVLELCGGFYQGFYKLYGYDYQTLPDHVNKAVIYSFKIKPSDSICSGVTGTTLNDVYPENKGIFFYVGTRAENKFWNYFEGLNTGCTSGCTTDPSCSGSPTQLCTIPKENEIFLSISGSNIPLYPNNNELITTDNKFLIFGRNKTGTLGTATTQTYSGETITFSPHVNDFDRSINPFLLFTRNYINDSGNCVTCNSCNCGCEQLSGQTETDQISIINKDPNEDINLNAFAFIIKDDGSIGYRYLYYDCNDNTTKVKEGFSVSGLVVSEEWNDVSIRWVAYDYIENLFCYTPKNRYGRLMIYVNCYLKHVVEDFPEIYPYNLNEIKEKQIAVPYNISLGGGTQGLLESMTFDGQDPDDLGLLIENNFAGSFIGQIANFKVFIEDIGWCGIKEICSI